MNGRFGWRRALEHDIDFIVLEYHGENGNALAAWITPKYGSNLARFTVDDKHVIDYEPSVLKAGGYTGTPVLYPTPNRVRSAVFCHRGRVFEQVKRGSPVFEHGLVHDEPWYAGCPDIADDSVALETHIDFDEDGAVFEAFPFRHTLALRFCLTREGVVVTYTITNKGDSEIPYGIGLHPYFIKLSGDEGTLLSIPAQSVMDATADLLPTGRLIDVRGTIYDLRLPVSATAIDLDHVFTDIPEGGRARIYYSSLRLGVSLEASRDFSHIVVYSPQGERYFCVESQTCSTDAHNLYDRGFKSESGLELAPSHSACSGTVRYLVLRGDDCP